MSVNIDYSNMVVGQNTEDTFKVPENCTRTCNGAELYFMKGGKPEHKNVEVNLTAC